MVVKLVIYRHVSENIEVDSIEAEDWGDFLIVHLNAEQIHPEIMQQLSEGFANMQKRVIIVPREWDVEFYGVKLDEPEDATEGRVELLGDAATPSS